MARTQEFRQLAINTPLGEDVLLLKSLRGTEELGRPFQYELELLSEDPNIVLDDLVGENVTLRAQSSADDEPRYFNGFVSEFSLGRPLSGTMEYRATVVPWLWFLTRTSDCRIFQEMTVPEIVKQVFRDHGFTDFEDRLTGTYRTWEYCVQYCETDFDFVSRLMEQEGIFYYFEHTNGKHTLVLANASSTHDAVAGYEEIEYRPPTESLREHEYVYEWAMAHQVQPGTYSHTDFDFKNPNKSLLATAKVDRPYATPAFEMYDYPGEYVETTDGENYARQRIDEYQVEYELAEGEADARGIMAGKRFRLTDHPRADQCQEYLVTRTRIEVGSDLFESGQAQPAPDEQPEVNYTVWFTAIEIHRPFRPRRITRRPMIRGPQTAVVVGPGGDEIYTDQYGRVKVQFHWDRYSKADENSSCWIRVAQAWAGKKWGGIYLPRIGHEVIVEFLEGDPDRPIITGRVYNGTAMPPYDLPANMTMSTMKTLSSKGGEGFNEIRFEDKKGEEQIFVHAEKNEDERVLNDSKEWIGNDRHLIVKKKQYELVDEEKHLIVKQDQKEKVEGDLHLKVSGNENEKVDQTISRQAGMKIQEKAGTNYAVDAGQEIHLKAGMKVIIEAGLQLTIKAAGSFVDIGPAGVSISGAMVKINSGGSAGSGSGSSPEAPVEPEEAKEADDDNAGEVSGPPPAPTPPTPVTYSSQATVMKMAAASGTPLVEKCPAPPAAEPDEEPPVPPKKEPEPEVKVPPRPAARPQPTPPTQAKPSRQQVAKEPSQQAAAAPSQADVNRQKVAVERAQEDLEKSTKDFLAKKRKLTDQGNAEPARAIRDDEGKAQPNSAHNQWEGDMKAGRAETAKAKMELLKKQTEMQQQQQRLQTLLKAQHDAKMAAIRNLR